jgi:hypothetical protein
MRLLVFLLLIIAAAAMADPVPGEFGDGLDTESYDCLITARQQKGISPASVLTVWLEWRDDANHTAVSLASKGITLTTFSGQKAIKRLPVSAALPVDTPFTLTIMRRGGMLGLALNSSLIYRGEFPRAGGTLAGMTAGKGWTIEAACVQALEPVVFADNFMRAKDEPGAWTIISGKWALQSAWDIESLGRSGRFTYQSYAQNPFAWVGCNPDGAAACMAGKPFWEDYTLTTALCPPVAGAAGVLVNLDDRQNGLLARWTPANDRSAGGNELALFRLAGGKRVPLARSAGGYLPGQWYRLSVESSPDGVRVLIDGVVRLEYRDTRNWRGGIGLYAEGAEGVVFDDLTVYGRGVNTVLLLEEQQHGLSRRMLADPIMQRWAGDWAPFPGQPSARLCAREFFGDHGLAVTLVPNPAEDGELWLGLNGDGRTLTGGYRAVVKRAAGKQDTEYTLYHDTRPLAAATGAPLQANEAYRLRFRRAGGRFLLEVDGETVVSAEDRSEPAGLLPFYWVSGGFTSVREPMASGSNVLDYPFTEAPVDWIAEGTWAPTVRWACDPKWSFFSGWSHGLAVLWHKREFHGDHSLEVYMGVKMEYPHYREFYDFRFRDLAVTLCSDGHDPRSGYTAIVGVPDAQGTPNRRTVLLRNGVEVAAVNLPLPWKDRGHNNWNLLALHKRGNTVELLFDGKSVIRYTDEQPLDGGVPAIWTKNNGISLARARLSFAEPPGTRAAPRVGIGEPDYSEWCDAGKTLALDFPTAASTTGNSVRMEVKPLGLPGKEAAPVIEGTRVSLTPALRGEHWYKINAVDGPHISPSVHVVFPVFDPALGRDDSRTLVLYRFTEGKGAIVEDHGKLGPPLNLHIPAPRVVRWLPGQGLELLEPTMPVSRETAAKLMALNGAGTFECWISATTLYPQTGWQGCLFAWDAMDGAAVRRNFAVGFHSWSLLLASGPGSLIQVGSPNSLRVPGLRMGLRHIVITWDGANTRIYMNGTRLLEQAYNWRADQWSKDALLYLGNQLGDSRTYLGTYYLLALHDRALTEEQVQRHYQAGPAGR